MATAGLVVLGAAQAGAALDASADAERARVLAGTATATVRLVHELERELGETAALRQRGGNSGRPLVDAQRRRVDEPPNATAPPAATPAGPPRTWAGRSTA